MSNNQQHFGKKFYEDKKTGYWICTKSDKPRYRAHVWVWINYNGLPPKGYHVHHINENRSDNRIENLELIKAKRHLEHHMRERMKNPDIKKKYVENCDKIRPLTKIWHASPEGKAWHSYHAIKNKFGNWEPVKKICDECKKGYETKKRGNQGNSFCCNACKSKWRRKSGVDDIIKNCLKCKKEFLVNKYAKKKYCCRTCSAKGILDGKL